MSGPSAGIAYYLALHSLINWVPLPRNLGSTGTVFKRPKVGGIGGLDLKLEYNVKKEKPINTFILSEENKRDEKYPEQSFEHIPGDIKDRINQVHFVNQVDQIETALQEILKNPDEKLVHSCGEEKPIPEPNKTPNPRDPPQPSSQITPEQLLSLITEYGSAEKKNPDLSFEDQDFWEKLKTSYSKKTNYKIAVNKSLRLQEEYLRKLERLDSQGAKTCLICHKKILKGFVTDDKRFFCSDECLEKATEQARNGLIQGWKESLVYIGKGQNNEQKKRQLLQEYQSKFQKITSSIANLTNEILINLENYGYTIQEAKWTSELQAPSLTIEDDFWSFIKPGVSFQLGKK